MLCMCESTRRQVETIWGGYDDEEKQMKTLGHHIPIHTTSIRYGFGSWNFLAKYIDLHVRSFL